MEEKYENSKCNGTKICISNGSLCKDMMYVGSYDIRLEGENVSRGQNSVASSSLFNMV